MKAKLGTNAKNAKYRRFSGPSVAAAPRAEKEALVASFASGSLCEAEAAARTLTEKFAADSFAWKALGAILAQQGRSQEALPPLRRALDLSPREPDTHNSLGAALQDVGRFAEAVASYQQALRLKPDYAEAHNNLGNALQQLARWDEAQASYQRALQLRPDYAEAHFNRGVVLQKLGRLEEALASYHRALRIEPDNAQAHFNRGVAAHDLGRLQEAHAAYHHAIAIRPDDAEAHNNLGNTMKEVGQLQEALACYQRALELKPDFAEAHDNLGVVLQDLGQFERAVESHQQALALRPDFASAHCNLGAAFQELGQLDRAADSLRQALTLQPDLAEAHCNLGSALQELGQLEQAAECQRRALAIRPDYAEAHYGEGRALHGLGQFDAAVASYRRALELEPHRAAFRSGLLFLLEYARTADPDARLREARTWEQQVLSESERAAARQRQFAISARLNRPLRLGIVSAELGRHAVACFLTSWMRAIDRDRVQLLLYPTTPRREPETALLQALADRWTPLHGCSDAEAAERIRADRVDVLIDTTGHTRDCRLGIVAHRAAPVQCHYIGYFATTGLTEMDYFLADEVLLPPELDSHFCETVWRLPRTWVAYAPLENAPEPAWQPAEHSRLRIGSFNHPGKLSAPCLALWARALEALPHAVLLLKSPQVVDRTVQARIGETLETHGVDKTRVQFLPNVADWRQHMSCYDQLDIALDTLPFGSGTTGFDALWMGVPLITLAGDGMAGRLGAAMLTGLGHSEWIAHTEDEYVEKVVSLAKDVERRVELRFDQRECMRHSPLCDAQGLARALESAFEAMFDIWWKNKQDV